MWEADAHFRTGKAHLDEGSLCQDYALSEVASDGKSAIAVVSDGCSTSGRTDVGARVWALAQRTIFRSRPLRRATHQPLFNVLEEAKAVGQMMSLDLADMDCTLGYVEGAPSGEIEAALYGDGIIVARTCGVVRYWRSIWANSLPGYPSYLLDTAYGRQFIKLASEKDLLPFRIHALMPGSYDMSELFSAEEGLKGNRMTFGLDTDLVAVLTDGYEQVRNGVETFAWDGVVRALTKFPNFNGPFARKRLNMYLKALTRRSYCADDDISIAVVARA
jgi:Protein phosphatase 2C